MSGRQEKRRRQAVGKPQASESTFQSVFCFLEEYPLGDRIGIRLREKQTGRKVEIRESNLAAKQRFGEFLSAPRNLSPDLSEFPGLMDLNDLDDYVLISGVVLVDNQDSIAFRDGLDLSYLYGPTPQSDAYNHSGVAVRAVWEQHANTARRKLRAGEYREAVTSSRLAVEAAIGDGGELKKASAAAPLEVAAALEDVKQQRDRAVHEPSTIIEQQDAENAVSAMETVLAWKFPAVTSHEPRPIRCFIRIGPSGDWRFAEKGSGRRVEAMSQGREAGDLVARTLYACVPFREHGLIPNLFAQDEEDAYYTLTAPVLRETAGLVRLDADTRHGFGVAPSAAVLAAGEQLFGEHDDYPGSAGGAHS